MSASKPWYKRMPRFRTTVSIAVVILLILLVWFAKWGPTGKGWSTGKDPDVSPDPAASAAETKHYKEHNVVKIRGKLYLFNGQEKTADELKELLSRLKVAKPECVIELEASGDESVGVVNDLKKMVQRNRLKYLSK